MNAGKVDALVILGGNPAFTSPADLDFAGAMGRMAGKNGLLVHLGLYHDETADLCHWHIPEAHFLESWGDARSFDGTVSLIQPLIAPLYNGHQAIEVLAALNGQAAAKPADMVKDYWTRAHAGQTTTAWTLQDAKGGAFASADVLWRHALHDGFINGTANTEYDGTHRYVRCEERGHAPTF